MRWLWVRCPFGTLNYLRQHANLEGSEERRIWTLCSFCLSFYMRSKPCKILTTSISKNDLLIFFVLQWVCNVVLKLYSTFLKFIITIKRINLFFFYFLFSLSMQDTEKRIHYSVSRGSILLRNSFSLYLSNF